MTGNALSKTDKVDSVNDIAREWNHLAAAGQVMAFGVPGFFTPRWPPPALAERQTPGAVSFYDTAPLVATLDRLVDWDRLNDGKVRLSVGAVAVETGNFRYFDTTTDRIDARHIMASGALPPGLPPVEGGAAFFPKAVFMSDPGQMVRLLALKVLQQAGFQQCRADRLTRQLDGIIVEGPGLRLRARQVVIAAGAHSRALAAQAGDPVPLDTERGYHVEWDMAAPRLTRPSCPTSRGFYLCPMTGRLRVAGTVELGGLTLPPSPHRIAKLIEGARAIFPDLPEPSRDWMGFRPSMPDSLPVIGPSHSATARLTE